jgi:hypothetical protein
MMRADPSGLIRRVERDCWLGITGANAVTALLVFPGAFYFAPVYFEDAEVGRLLSRAAVAAVFYIAFGAITGYAFIVRPSLGPATRWLSEGREPDEDERKRLATQPSRQATPALAYWLLLPVWGVPYLAYFADIHFVGIVLVKFVNGLLVLAVVAWTLSYLFVERAIRPLLAIAMSGAPSSEPRTMGVFRRLLVAWVTSAGLPLWGIVVVLYGLDAEQRAAAIPYVYMSCASGAVAGIVATIIASRAITDPDRKSVV